MLARVANNLFWMGRYIERSEHMSRYMNVNYFSSLDAPNQHAQHRQFVLRSLRFMAGNQVQDPDVFLDEKAVLFDIGLNPDSGSSIINNVKAARENANGARDLISTELYEAINKFYHYVLNYEPSFFVQRGLYDFCVNVSEQSAVLRGKIRSTLLHDEVYAIILMGVNLERATQIVRIIRAKYYDALQSAGDRAVDLQHSFEWSTLLKCAECYDMMRRFYKKPPSFTSTLEFLVLNGDNPRSVMNSLNQVHRHIEMLDPNKHPQKNSTAFLVGKLRAQFQYMQVDEIDQDVKKFIEHILNDLMGIGERMEQEYFHY